jgi:hypothetical protein
MDLEGDVNEIWIQFNSYYYDYYVGPAFE